MDNQPNAILKASLNANYKSYNRPWCLNDSQRFALAVKSNELMPTVLYRNTISAPVTSTLLKAMDGTTLATLTSAFTWSIETYGAGQILYPTITLPLSLSAHEGKLCFLRITDGTNTWETEVMKIYNPAELSHQPGSEKCGWVKISFQGACRIGKIPAGVTQFIYLQTFIGEANFEVLLSGEKAGNEVDNNYFGLVEMIQNMTVMAPDYVVAALSVLPLVSNPLLGTVSVQDQWNNIVNAQRITFEQNWLKGSCLAQVRYSFTSDLVTAKPCCDDENAFAACLAADVTVMAILADGGAEYSGGYYTLNGDDVDFVAGDLALSYNSGISPSSGAYRLIEWTGSAWTILTTYSQFDNCFSVRESKWVFKLNGTTSWADRPVIDSFTVSGSTRTVKGRTFKGSLVRLSGMWFPNGCNYITLGSIATQSQFFSTGILIQSDTGAISACALAGACGELACSLPVASDSLPC